MTRVSVKQLRSVADRLFKHLEEIGCEAVELENDYYWHIPREARYCPSAEPNGLTIGQLSDDWSELQRIDRAEAPPIGYALVWLGRVAAAVGEEVVG